MDAILGTEKIEKLATWPDDIRGGNHPGPLYGTQSQIDFDAVAAHHGHDKWHYVNLPLGAVSYASSGEFTSSHDVVRMIGECVKCLEGQSDLLSKRDALSWLIHLVGDIHQPLHVGVGYFSFDADGTAHLHRDPAEAAMYKDGNDIGGNKLVKGTTKLHSYWDGSIPKMIASDATALAGKITDNFVNVTDSTSGEHPTWPAQWATESTKVSNEKVYDSTLDPKRKGFPPEGGWNIETDWPSNYGAAHKGTALTQLTLAAKRLADILNAIQWPAQ